MTKVLTFLADTGHPSGAPTSRSVRRQEDALWSYFPFERDDYAPTMNARLLPLDHLIAIDPPH